MQEFSSKLSYIFATAMTDCQKVENAEGAVQLSKKLIADIAYNFLPKHTIEITEPAKEQDDSDEKLNFSVRL